VVRTGKGATMSQGETNAEKQAAWEALKAQAAAQFGEEMVFGEGPVDARFVMIGEAPGENEVIAKRPFVGRAGQLLNRLLQDAGIDRKQVYVTNVVKVRPTAPGVGSRLKNRAPRVGEIKEGLALLLPELALLAPEALILFGNTPAKALIGKDFAMGTNRGVWFTTIAGIPALATYHPAYILRQEGEFFDRTREVVLNDLVTARGALDTPPVARELG
jgi:uracil-DNA glycosylase family 4